MKLIKLKIFFYVFFTILSCQTSNALEKNKSATLQIENFLKNLVTLEANFIQVSPSGNVSNGKIYLNLPGKLRIDYENPENLLITCKGFWIVIQDRDAKTTNHIPVKSSPFGILLDIKSILSNQNIITEPEYIKQDYNKRFLNFIDYYKQQLGKNKIDYSIINTSMSLDVALSEFLSKRKKII